MTRAQHLTAELIEQLMCYGRIELDALRTDAGPGMPALRQSLARLAQQFAPLVTLTGDRLHVDKDARPLLRIIAACLDETAPDGATHAVAI